VPSLSYNQDLLELIKHFYVLTGMRVVLFDENYTELVSYPKDGIPFCSCMRENEVFKDMCRKSDIESFKRCTETKSLTIYKCHAGLIEATAPLTDNGTVIGYIMFGQITDEREKNDILLKLENICAQYNNVDIESKIKSIKYRSEKQILAASKILEACTSYILMKDMVRRSGKQLIKQVENYVDEHLSEHINVKVLCKALNISRTRLYEATSPYTSGGIAEFVRIRKLEYAKKMIINTDISISEIAYNTGFSEYNYFLKAFKKYFGVSPKVMRNQNRESSPR